MRVNGVESGNLTYDTNGRIMLKLIRWQITSPVFYYAQLPLSLQLSETSFIGQQKLFFYFIFFISQYHCNLSEDIQQSCLTVTINGM